MLASLGNQFTGTLSTAPLGNEAKARPPLRAGHPRTARLICGREGFGGVEAYSILCPRMNGAGRDSCNCRGALTARSFLDSCHGS